MKKLTTLLFMIVSLIFIFTACNSKENTTTFETTTHPAISSTVPATSTSIPTTSTTTPTTSTTAPETTVPITYTSASWMSALPNDTMLNHIVLPGTHDSGSTTGGSFAQCQDLTIAEQLEAGVRYFDIRLRRVNGVLQVYHGMIDQKLTFEEVLNACYTFFDENPSEAVIMCIKEEYDASGTNVAFDTMVKSHIDAAPSRWYIGTGIPTLEAVRGKIVLMRRFSTSGSLGFNASSTWMDNTTFTLTTGACKLTVQDYYKNTSADAKWKVIKSFFAIMKPAKNTYYLNNTSGYLPIMDIIPDITSVSNAINPKLIDYLKTNPDIVGIVATDFITAEIANLIYELNFS